MVNQNSTKVVAHKVSIGCMVPRIKSSAAEICHQCTAVSKQATNNCTVLQSISEKTVLVTFPCDDAHSAFITTVIEGVGIGSDFGSVVVLPVTGGMAAYRHQVLPPQTQPQQTVRFIPSTRSLFIILSCKSLPSCTSMALACDSIANLDLAGQD